MLGHRMFETGGVLYRRFGIGGLEDGKVETEGIEMERVHKGKRLTAAK